MMALAPMQDFLSLDTTARMNFPGKSGGNWTWRMPVSAFDHPWIDRLKDLNWLYSRSLEDYGKPKRPDRDRVLY
jgi:4-alpha-glucanotransferase